MRITELLEINPEINSTEELDTTIDLVSLLTSGVFLRKQVINQLENNGVLRFIINSQYDLVQLMYEEFKLADSKVRDIPFYQLNPKIKNQLFCNIIYILMKLDKHDVTPYCTLTTGADLKKVMYNKYKELSLIPVELPKTSIWLDYDLEKEDFLSDEEFNSEIALRLKYNSIEDRSCDRFMLFKYLGHSFSNYLMDTPYRLAVTQDVLTLEGYVDDESKYVQDKVKEIYRKEYNSMSEFIQDLMKFYDDYKIYL